MYTIVYTVYVFALMYTSFCGTVNSHSIVTLTAQC